MKMFKEFPQNGAKCLICGSNENKACVLIQIAGTQKGLTAEATPAHLDCIELIYDPNTRMIVQILQ